jgi:hypothetical protein
VVVNRVTSVWHMPSTRREKAMPGLRVLAGVLLAALSFSPCKAGTLVQYDFVGGYALGSFTLDFSSNVVVAVDITTAPFFEGSMLQNHYDVPGTFTCTDLCRARFNGVAYSLPSLKMTATSESLSPQGSDGGDSWPGKRLPSRST